MKKSQYNIFYRNEQISNQYVAYNALTQAMAVITKDDYDSYNHYVNENKEIPTALFNGLIQGGFLVEENIDEYEYMKKQYYQTKYDLETLQITVAPTLNCNFDCPYCFEKYNRSVNLMPEEIQKDLVNYVANKMGKAKYLQVIWYGGEPLMALSTIESLTEAFKEIARKNGVSYSASMITNGYLLSEKVAHQLKSLDVSKVQITLDGMSYTHDKTRYLVNENPTFHVIVNHIVSAIDFFDEIKIRVNGSPQNKKSCFDLLAFLDEKNLSSKITISLAKLDNILGGDEKFYYTEEEFAEFSIQFKLEALKRGFFNNLSEILPFRIQSVCNATVNNAFVVDADGDLYKCWDDIGNKSLKYGNIKNIESMLYSDKMETLFLNYSGFEIENCKKCNILPICLGGCPKKIQNENKTECTSYKYGLRFMFDHILKNYQV